jgi:septal ring factor EnvC (AmiA/AmiB activator)
MSTTAATTHKPHVVAQTTTKTSTAAKAPKALKPLRTHTTATSQASHGATAITKHPVTTPTHKSGHTTAAKHATSGEKLIKPVDGPITAHVGDMASYRAGRHTGTDFGVGIGTPVHAAATGKVVSAKADGAFGNEVILQHGPHRFTQYAHLSAFASGLSVGDTVKQGDVIGKSGNTGNTTGPHLHFEVRDQAGFDRMNPNDPEQEFGKSMADLGAGRLPKVAPAPAAPSTSGASAPSGGSSASSGGSSAPSGGGSSSSRAPHHAHVGGGHHHHRGGGVAGGGGVTDAGPSGVSTDVVDQSTALVPLTADDYAQLPAQLAALLQQFAALAPEQQAQELTAKVAAIPVTDPSAPVTDEQQQAIDAQRAELELYVRAAAPEVAAQFVPTTDA